MRGENRAITNGICIVDLLFKKGPQVCKKEEKKLAILDFPSDSIFPPPHFNLHGKYYATVLCFHAKGSS
jgi:hypothetical protein